MQPRESVKAHFGRARGLFKDLVSCDEPTTEESSITRVLEGLLSDFSNMEETVVFQVAAHPENAPLYNWQAVTQGDAHDLDLVPRLVRLLVDLCVLY
jgi:hypothetical protein